MATAKDMINASSQEGRRILNALSLPLTEPKRPFEKTLASDAAAWSRLAYLNAVKFPYPTMEVQWGIAGTSGAFSQWHVDACGFGSVVDVETGYKLWIVARPRHCHLGDINVYFDKQFNVMAPNNGQFVLEAVLLRPGDRL